MENITALKSEAYKIATSLLRPGYPEFGYIHDTNTRLKAMEVYAQLVSAEQARMKGDNS